MAFLLLSFVYLATPLVAAYQTCPVLGPDFPLPSNLASSARLEKAFGNLAETLEQSLATGLSAHGPMDNSSSYAVQFFSIDDEKPIYEYYYTSEALKDSTAGVKEVKGDSIFRIGSISKLLTVYTLLAEVGDSYWDVPVTEVIPELRSHIEKGKNNAVEYAAWESITLGALAGQVAGLPRDVMSSGDVQMILELGGLDPTDYGLPQLAQSDYPICMLNSTDLCNREKFFAKAVDTRTPTWAPNSIPAYSNTAYQVLAYAVESIVGEPFQELFERSIVEQLGLQDTSYDIPASTEQGVIPSDPSSSYWNAEVGDAIPMGGMFSTANDLTTIGRSILASSLLDTNTTRAWLKPTTFTGSLTASVGRPWEIFRQVGVGAPNRITDYYTKGGDIGAYHTNLALLPDYGVGFAVLAAGAGGGPLPIQALVADIVTPELEAVAREQADVTYSGTYKAAGNVNSTITLSTDPEFPGFSIDSFISNSSDALTSIAALSGIPREDSIVRLYPTNLEKCNEDGTKDISFRILSDRDPGYKINSFFASCGSWYSVDGYTYGQEAIDQLVFTVDKKTGKVLSVTSAALKVKMDKVE